MTIIDWTGFLGVTILLSAYFLNVTKRLSPESRTYILLNFVGATIACIASILLKYIPFIILEGVWALVSLKALLKY